MLTDDVVWIRPSEFAREFRKSHRTILYWVSEGFIISLGYRVRRSATGYLEIGVPRCEYSRYQSRKMEQSVI